MGINKSGPIIIILAVMFVSVGWAQAQARENYRGMLNTVTRSMPMEEILASKETCIQCHTRVTPMVVAQHQAGPHLKAGLDCRDCHGADHRDMPLVTGKKACIKCHQKETAEMLASKHAISWDKMWNNARYLAIPEAMRQQGCARCHDIGVGFKDVKDVRCDYCHTNHQFSVKEARHPAACTTCHMGPDHPQAEAFAASGHGKQYAVEGKGPEEGGTSATCVTCHLAGGNHNVSNNIGIGGVSNGGVLEDWYWALDAGGKPKLKRQVVTRAAFNQARAGNMALCGKCHTADFNNQWLGGADQVKEFTDRLLLQAEELVTGLEREGLLYPAPAARAGNPAEGQKLVLGGNQLYSGISKAEAIYFKMYKFAAAQAWKSAYHQDFQRAGTKGIGELQGLMAELQAEADLLRLLGPVQDREKDKAPVTDMKNPRPAYLPYMLGGLLLGSGLAVLVYFNKKKKTGLFTGLIVIMASGSFWFSVPEVALAWGENPGEQKQCSSCHQEKSRQLKTGGHAGLACLDCHTAGSAISRVRKPETCGKCHNETTGYELEIYLSSPHGVQYQIKGSGLWVPTCATCHMPQGTHSPRSKLAGNESEFKGMIGEVCLKCHTTDHVLKFNQDKTAIYKSADDLIKELTRVRQDLIAKGILVPHNSDKSQWQLANLKQLPPREREAARKLADELDMKTKAGVFEDAVKLKSGTAHVNPDYAHWYGNAYLNLNLAEVKTTARELEMLAERAGFTPGVKGSAALWPAILLGGVTAAGSFAVVTIAIRIRQRQ
jgi:hypothetical protein